MEQKVDESKRKRRQYTRYDMFQALRDIKENSLSYHAAAKKYNVPKSTLFDKFKNSIPVDAKPGPTCILGSDTEKMLVEIIKDRESIGFPYSLKRLSHRLLRVLEINRIPNPFENKVPGVSWIKNFSRRHYKVLPPFSGRKHDNSKTEIASEEEVRQWQNNFLEHIKKRLPDFEKRSKLLTNPSRNFHADELDFLFNKKNNEYLRFTDDSRIPITLSSPEELSASVVLAFNALGQIASPLFVFKGQPSNPLEDTFPSDWLYRSSETGWLQSKDVMVFLEQFVTWCHIHKIHFPIILTLDAFSAHIQEEVADFCDDNQIILYLMPTSIAKVCQPSLFIFSKIRKRFAELLQSSETAITTLTVTPLLKEILDQLPKDSFSESFEKAGVFPLHEQNVGPSSDYFATEPSVPSTTVTVKGDYSYEQADSTSSESPVFDQDEQHLKSTVLVLENRIPSDILDKFKKAKQQNKPKINISGYQALYTIWSSIVNDLQTLEEDPLNSYSGSEEQIEVDCEITEEFDYQELGELPATSHSPSSSSNSNLPSNVSSSVKRDCDDAREPDAGGKKQKTDDQDPTIIVAYYYSDQP